MVIIHLLDEAADHLPRLLGVAVAAPSNLLLLERFHEALRLGISTGIGGFAHTAPGLRHKFALASIASTGKLKKFAAEFPAAGNSGIKPDPVN